jgi:hypothetical protein
LAIIELSIAEIAKRLIMLAQQYLTGEQAVRIQGSEAEPLWLEFDKDYIKGEFDFEVEGGSTQPVNESFRRQMAMQVVDAMAPFASAGIIDMPKLANYVLQYGFGIRSAASFIVQPQMPAQPVTPQGVVPPEAMPPQGMPPEGMMPQGMPEMGMGPMGLPTDAGVEQMGGGSLPPEILALLAQQGGIPPGM